MGKDVAVIWRRLGNEDGRGWQEEVMGHPVGERSDRKHGWQSPPASRLMVGRNRPSTRSNRRQHVRRAASPSTTKSCCCCCCVGRTASIVPGRASQAQPRARRGGSAALPRKQPPWPLASTARGCATGTARYEDVAHAAPPNAAFDPIWGCPSARGVPGR